MAREANVTGTLWLGERQQKYEIEEDESEIPHLDAKKEEDEDENEGFFRTVNS